MRHIVVLTGGRMTYGYSRPVMRKIAETPGLRYSLIVTNQHLLSTFGSTVEEIEQDGLNITDRIYMALDGYNTATMTKSLGVFLLGLTDALVRLKPDIVLVVGDRGEHFMGALAGAHMNIPVAHIQAGELSGNIDGMTRHAIARFAHIHFASNQDAADRLKRTGEHEFRIFLTGAPQLDELMNGEFAGPDEIAKKFELDLEKPIILLAQHSVTEEFEDAATQMTETLEAVCGMGVQTVLIFPNNDAGSGQIQRLIEQHGKSHLRVERNLQRRFYAGLMNVVSVLVGNSSSGLIEAPCFKLPAVNIGNRQRDRVRGNNVIDVPYDRVRIRAAIEKALSPEFRKLMAESCVNPYVGDGHVSERIVEILRTIPITEELLKKQIAVLKDTMTKNMDMFTVKVTDSIRTAMEKISVNHYRVAIVLDGKRVVGTASDGDIRRALLRDVMPIAPVEKIMNINCKTTTERDPRKQAEIIRREMVTVLPVVNVQNELVDVAVAYEPFTDSPEVQTTSIGKHARAFTRRLATAVTTRLAYRRFKTECGSVFEPALRAANAPPKTVLIVSVGMLGAIKVELALIKALELAGYTATVLTERGPCLPYYRLAGVDRFVSWDQFLEPVGTAAVSAVLGEVRSFSDLISLRRENARVGRYTASTALRQLRIGSFDLSPSELRASFQPYMKASLAYAAASARLISAVRPELVLSMDPGYTPRGELYDACLAAGIDTITWNAAHRNNTLMLKRYRAGNCDVHPASLSDDTWTRLREEPWTDEKRQAIRDELRRSYASGDWYSEVGTQFNTRSVTRDEVVERLALDAHRKTAVIFPHIFWDGTFFWGIDLFSSYAEWFVETVRAAAANTEVNWIVKVHPAHTVKNAREGFHGECSEMLAIREHFGELPPHIRLMPPDSDINTFSLFEVMDYCVTVRGTVGIEAATFGIPVLTAGSGRYNGRGFTIDSTSREEYIARIARIQDIPRLSGPERELAERYAYGLFVRRPLHISTVRLEYQKDAKASPRTHVSARTSDDLRNAPDLRAFSDWVISGRDDFDAGDQAMRRQSL